MKLSLMATVLLCALMMVKLDRRFAMVMIGLLNRCRTLRFRLTRSLTVVGLTVKRQRRMIKVLWTPRCRRTSLKPAVWLILPTMRLMCYLRKVLTSASRLLRTGELCRKKFLGVSSGSQRGLLKSLLLSTRIPLRAFLCRCLRVRLVNALVVPTRLSVAWIGLSLNVARVRSLRLPVILCYKACVVAPVCRRRVPMMTKVRRTLGVLVSDPTRLTLSRPTGNRRSPNANSCCRVNYRLWYKLKVRTGLS